MTAAEAGARDPGRMGEELPGGLVTFVFTDIVGSSRLFREFGDQYVEALEAHHALLRAVWVAHDGVEVSTAGDAFFVAFGSARAAMQACVAAQRAIAGADWPTGLALSIRIGSHAGLAFPRGDNYVAFAVHQAARIGSAAVGDQILVTSDVVEACGFVPEWSFAPLGRFHVRDFDHPIELFNVVGPGLAPVGPPTARPVEHHNLVRPRTTFVGRHAELDELSRLVERGGLVTVAGPGGLGKTRLVTEWGLANGASWPDGVWFVDLSAASADLVPLTIAAAFGDLIRPGEAEWPAVLAHLRNRTLALLLDNCEHVLDTVADLVDEILDGCPGVAAVATSRAPLGVTGEQVWRMRPLDVEGAAAELFLDRVRLADPAFEPTDDDRADITEICRRLDGLPLAIELAAARGGQLHPREIRLGIEASLLDRAASGRSRQPDRQRTMQALIGWSWDLLDDDVRAAFAACSVFAGSFDTAAGCAVIAAAAPGNDALQVLLGLVDASLVVREAGAGVTRFRMLETIRSYASQRLADSGRADAAVDAAARHYLDRCGLETGPLDRSRRDDARDAADNLRALIPIVAAYDVETAQALACVVMAQDDVRSNREAIEQGRGYLADLPAPSVHRLALIALQADSLLFSDQIEAVWTLLAEADELRAGLGADPVWDEAHIDAIRCSLLLMGNDRDAALAAATSALANVRTTMGRARINNVLALVYAEREEYPAAFESARRAYEAELERGMPLGLATAHGNLAELSLRMGDDTAVAVEQGAALRLGLELGSERVVADSVLVAGRLAGRAGRWAQAVELAGWGTAELDRLGMTLYPSDEAATQEIEVNARASGITDEDLSTLRERGRAANLLDMATAAREVFEAIARAAGNPGTT